MLNVSFIRPVLGIPSLVYARCEQRLLSFLILGQIRSFVPAPIRAVFVLVSEFG